ncbi:hypothetical protein NM2005040_0243 [Neisseria meningitidis 2005040]|nr:hypothetical protein NM2005040_0243 [Neisseria meningitidis 2005040]
MWMEIEEILSRAVRYRDKKSPPPPPFQWAFFIKRKISRHSHAGGNLERKI